MTGIVRFDGSERVDAVRALLVAYVKETRRGLVARSLNPEPACLPDEAELRELPGSFGPPRGAMLVAVERDLVAGSVALRAVDDSMCEMKRMFVAPAWRGTGLGRRLAVAIVDEARALGYETMRLETLPTMAAAAGLYASLGFVECGTFGSVRIPGTRYMRKDLRQGGASHTLAAHE